MAMADFATRVTRVGAFVVAALAAGAWWLFGAPAAAGVGGGGAVAFLNFRWLARDLGRAFAVVAEGQAGLGRIGRIGLRQVAILGSLAALIVQGWAHPVAVGVGLATLPPVLLVEGLLNARGQEEG
jgi:ATP synthase I chain